MNLAKQSEPVCYWENYFRSEAILLAARIWNIEASQCKTVNPTKQFWGCATSGIYLRTAHLWLHYREEFFYPTQLKTGWMPAGQLLCAELIYGNAFIAYTLVGRHTRFKAVRVGYLIILRISARTVRNLCWNSKFSLTHIKETGVIQFNVKCGSTYTIFISMCIVKRIREHSATNDIPNEV